MDRGEAAHLGAINGLYTKDTKSSEAHHNSDSKTVAWQ